MSVEDDGFLGRWSRLKRGAAKPAPEPEPEASPETEAPAEPETLSEEELAALPRIEDLTEGSDIRAFLRAGVPRQLRNAALRRVWMLTPAIRDYRDPAVDYAWDWNTPGGVPGDGVAPTPERAAAMLRTLFAPRENDEPAKTVPDKPGAGNGQETLAGSADEVAAKPFPEETEVAATEAPNGPDPAPDEMPRRRHGSALPL